MRGCRSSHEELKKLALRKFKKGMALLGFAWRYVRIVRQQPFSSTGSWGPETDGAVWILVSGTTGTKASTSALQGIFELAATSPIRSRDTAIRARTTRIALRNQTIPISGQGLF